MNDIEQNIILCNRCALSIDLNIAPHKICPRCREKLSFRKFKSIQLTFALTTTALLLYLPANIYPIMIIEKLNQLSPDTIISGIIELFNHGMYLIGSVVFLASIIIPLLKIIVLFFLLFRTQFPSKHNKKNTTLFHILEFIGKWSMLDIYVIAIFMSLVKLGFFTQVKTGPASTYFTLVVILTLLASHSFDPRFLWDKSKESHD